MQNQMYQVSTLQALMQGYTKGVITSGQLLDHGDTGLGTFADVNGELIVVDNMAYKANNEGDIVPVPYGEGIPFAAVAFTNNAKEFKLEHIENIEQLKSVLNNSIEEDFGLNSMFVIRIDANFTVVRARSEAGMHSQHVQLSEILKDNQKDFSFENIEGNVVCIYFPDYMDGINAPGWHLHFVSADRKHGGHVFDLSFEEALVKKTMLQNLQIQLPTDKSFDTYELKGISNDDIKKVEQSDK